MTILFLALWLQMSAPNCGQGYSYPPAQGVGCYTDGIVPRAADETDGKLPPCKMDDGTPCEYKAYVGKIHEPVDVPAVQVELPKDDWPIGFAYTKAECDKRGDDWLGVGNYCARRTTKQTCADKSRILEHDENSPPKYWCHKVQP